MHYDDPKRPHSDGAMPTALQKNGSPLPAISLIRPMHASDQDDDWGFLCCIHAHKGENRFGTYYAVLRDLGQFQRDFMEDPEGALLRYFKYDGPHWEPTAHSPRAPREQVTEEDIFA